VLLLLLLLLLLLRGIYFPFSSSHTKINYILERFQDACRLYEEMEALFGYHTDLLCNLIATHVRLDDAGGMRRLLEKYQAMINGSFECIYNVGTGANHLLLLLLLLFLLFLLLLLLLLFFGSTWFMI
jgi:hypothetical protein